MDKKLLELQSEVKNALHMYNIERKKNGMHAYKLQLDMYEDDYVFETRENERCPVCDDPITDETADCENCAGRRTV